MSRISDILAQRVKVDVKYQFTITAAGFSQILDTAPDGFANGHMKLIRNKTYRGLFRKYVVDTLIFYQDGKDVLQTFYDNYGIDYDVFLQIDTYSGSILTSYLTLKLDFATYKVDSISVQIQAVDSSFAEKVKNREDNKVNLFSLVSIDGDTITDFPNALKLIDTSINSNAVFGGITGAAPETNIVPLTLTTSDFTEAKTPDTTQVGSYLGAFFFKSTSSRKLTAAGTLAGSVTNINQPSITVTVNLTLYRYDVNGVEKEAINLGYASGTDNVNFSITFSEIIFLNYGDSLSIQGVFTGDSAGGFHGNYSSLSVTVNETYQGLFAKSIIAFDIYEAFLRVLQLLTGADDVLRSTTFGRTDTPFFTYATDGILLHLTKGRLLRDGENRTFPTTLKGLFQDVNSMYNIGLGIEDDKIRIETIDYFYQNGLTLDISSKITEDMISTSVNPERIFKQIKVGFNKFGTDKSATDDNSWREFNTKATYSTEIKSVMTSLNLMSNIRADGTAIVRLANDIDLSKEASGDNDLFFLKSVRDTSGFKIATNEGYTMIDGSPYANASLNLDLSPARSLYRWGKIIKAGLKTGVIRWQNTDNNYQLSTQKTGEVIITEASDIDYSLLDPKIFKGEKYKVTVPLTFSEINIIFGNPYGLIKLSDTQKGWIDEIDVNNEDNTVILTLLPK